MTDVERAALLWADRHLRSWRCDVCGGRWITTRSLVALFHQCRPRRQHPLSAFWGETPSERRHAENNQWALRTFGPALEDAVIARDGPDALLRGEPEAGGPPPRRGGSESTPTTTTSTEDDHADNTEDGAT